MQENHGTVVQWTEENFGPAASNFRVVTRANEELAEAFRALAAGDFRATQVECADTIIVLCRPAASFGLDWEHFELDRPAMPNFHDMAAYLNEANRWMAQLLCALAVDDRHYDAPRCLMKCYRALQGCIDHVGFGHSDVAHLITSKMATNRARRWGKAGDGTGYHVRANKGLRSVGTFMNIPLWVDESMPPDTFKIMARRLNVPDAGDRTQAFAAHEGAQ